MPYHTSLSYLLWYYFLPFVHHPSRHREQLTGRGCFRRRTRHVVWWYDTKWYHTIPYISTENTVQCWSSELAPKTNRGQRHHRGGLSSTPLQSPAGKINHRRSFDSFFSAFEVVLSPEKLAKGKRTACLSLNVGEAGTRGAPIIITCAITSQCHTPQASLPRNIVRL